MSLQAPALLGMQFEPEATRAATPQGQVSSANPTCELSAELAMLPCVHFGI